MSRRSRCKLKLLRFIAYMDQNGLCYYCKKPMRWNQGSYKSCTVEHLIDLKYGGKTIQENVVAAHFTCNSIKGRSHRFY